jgi:predicted nucleic-acid-binding protein
MIALDTNILVRFLVEDDATQSARAAALVQRAVERDEEMFVSHIVLCEVVWVLQASYRVQREEIVAVLRRLMTARHLRLDSPDILDRALSAFETGRGDFADYVIREQAMEAGCTSVATFDRALLKESGFARP